MSKRRREPEEGEGIVHKYFHAAEPGKGDDTDSSDSSYYPETDDDDEYDDDDDGDGETYVSETHIPFKPLLSSLFLPSISSSSSSSSSSKDSSIVVYLSAHGGESIAEDIKVESNIYTSGVNINFLSFVGSSCTFGNLAQNKELPPINVFVLLFLAEKYSSFLEQKLSLEDIFQLCPYFLEVLYNQYYDVNYDKGFQIQTPPNQRFFQFKPGVHENCLECTIKGDTRCIEIRDIDSRPCPSYGIIGVASSNKSDKKYTIDSLKFEEKHSSFTKKTEKFNFLSKTKEGKYSDTGLHWLRRAGVELDDNGTIKKRKFSQEPSIQRIAHNLFEKKDITFTELIFFLNQWVLIMYIYLIHHVEMQSNLQMILLIHIMLFHKKTHINKQKHYNI